MIPNPLIPLIVCAAAAGLALIALALAVFAWIRARSFFRAAREQYASGLADCQASLSALTGRLDGLTTGQRELEQQVATAAVIGPPKPALNLTKRCQALRMHRHGDPPEQIASLLEIPAEEVHLLLKVHQIVMHSL